MASKPVNMRRVQVDLMLTLTTVHVESTSDTGDQFVGNVQGKKAKGFLAAVCKKMTDAFPDGVWLVELAALSDLGLVPQVVAQALEVKEQPTRPVMETLSDYLASKKLLLVLDNVEPGPSNPLASRYIFKLPQEASKFEGVPHEENRLSMLEKLSR